jgi:hypothetical protein
MSTKPGGPNWAVNWENSAIGSWQAEQKRLADRNKQGEASAAGAAGRTDRFADRIENYETPGYNAPAPWKSGSTLSQASQALLALGQRGAGGGGSYGQNATLSGSGGSGSIVAGNELSKFSADDVSSFDPTQYGETFARGAEGTFRMTLADELEALQNSSVGAGRFRTGLFDADQGTVVTRLGQDFNNRIAEAAVQFSGQRLDALGRGADLRFRRADSMDRNTLDASRGNAEMSLRAQEQAAAAQSQSIRDQIAALTASGNLGNMYDGNSLEAWKFSSGQGFDAWKHTTTTNADMLKTGLSSALDIEQERRRADEFNQKQMGSYQSSNVENAMIFRDREDERERQRRAEQARLQAEAKARNTIGGTPYRKPVNTDPHAAIAKALGVPYQK